MFTFDANIRLGDLISAAGALSAIVALYIRSERILAALQEWRKNTDLRLLTMEAEVRDNSEHVAEIRGTLRLAGRAAKE